MAVTNQTSLFWSHDSRIWYQSRTCSKQVPEKLRKTRASETGIIFWSVCHGHKTVCWWLFLVVHASVDSVHSDSAGDVGNDGSRERIEPTDHSVGHVAGAVVAILLIIAILLVIVSIHQCSRLTALKKWSLLCSVPLLDMLSLHWKRLIFITKMTKCWLWWNLTKFNTYPL